MTIATPAKKARTGAYQPVSGSSTIKQTDQLHSKPLLLDAKSVSNKENLPIAPASVVSPSINTAAKPKRITTTKSAPIPDLVTQESLFEILNIPVTDSRLKTQSSSSDLLNTPFTTSAENSFDDILNTPLTIDTSSTPFMFDTSLFNDTESQNPATDSSSTTSPICHTSPSNSSISAVNDACFSDISDVYSPPSSIELASSLQVNKKSESSNYDPLITRLLNYYADITQTSPKQKTVAMPGNLALPPASAAKTVSNNNNSKYTMADINNLLNDNNDIIPATPATTTTTSASVTNWINDFDYLFP